MGEERGNEMMLVAACRDVLRMVSTQEGTDYEDSLAPMIKEADGLSQPLWEVWTDGLSVYQSMGHDHQTVIDNDGCVSEEGVHTNQAESLWSLLQPWLAKFRGLFQVGIQADRSHIWLSPLAGPCWPPLHGLIDCIGVTVFR